MTTYIKRPRFTARKKEAFVAYLWGEINQQEAAKAFNLSRQNFPNIANNVLRALVMEGKVDITKLLKDF